MALIAIPMAAIWLVIAASLWLFFVERRRGRRRTGPGSAAATLDLFNQMVFAERKTAQEYRQENHDEEDHAGGRKVPAFFPGVSDGELVIRPLRDTPDDIGLMVKWLSDERVLAFYEGRDNPFDEAMVRAKFIDDQPEQEVRCLIALDGRPIGYLQFYPLNAEEHAHYGYDDSCRTYGIDQFIGETDLWNRGIGTRMVRLMLAYLFEMEGAGRVMLDPRAENQRAIRSYEKSGFRKVKLLPGQEKHEGVWHDCWLMEVSPATVQPPTYDFHLLI